MVSIRDIYGPTRLLSVVFEQPTDGSCTKERQARDATEALRALDRGDVHMPNSV
jgi:hypothetical protein